LRHHLFGTDTLPQTDTIMRRPGTDSLEPPSDSEEGTQPMPLARETAVKPPSALAPHELAGLVARAVEGDVAAFERLIGHHQAKVYTFAFAFTGSPDLAEDLAQEALVKVYRSLGSFRFQSAFSTWLYSIVKNTYLDAMKSRAGRERALEDPLTDHEVAGLREAATAEERLLQKETRRALFRALRQVPLTYRAVVTMADVQGLGYDEIAVALSVPLGTVKSRLKRGRDALKLALFRQREEEP
jgi:RNA polymerase sigma-70 factor, ECF subfamily